MAAYPAGDLILLFALMVIIYYRSEKFIIGSIWILALGTLVMIVTDSIYSYQSLSDSYNAGNVLDAGWLISYTLIALAGIYQAIAARNYKEEPLPDKNSTIQEIITKALSYMPYLWVAGAFFLLLKNHVSELGINSYSLLIGVGFIIGFVIIRQILALTEINRLYLNLKKALKLGNLQAAELNQKNQDLQQEIIKRKNVEEQLLHVALHDGLTGLANRVLFIDRLRHAVEVAKRAPEFHFSVLFLDLDNFKSINDRLGHLSGDLTLIEIAQRIKNCIRSIDTVARLGGDEFVILLENTPGENISTCVANRILNEIKIPIIQKGNEVLITGSIGIVQEISEYDNSEDILRDVDIAMYRAKEMGKARFEIFTVNM
jgi:diguanylate cyclase (GGDEF)-like protein